VCFSATELRQFIEAIGLAAEVGQDKGMQEMARLLVRHFERQGSLEALVTRLRQARPLMEWPEPSALPAFATEGVPPPTPPPLPPGPAGIAAPFGAAPPIPPAASSRGAPPSPDAEPRILADPYASPGAPLAPGWPGTVAPAEAPPSGAGRLKIGLLVAGAAIAVAIAAFAIGRASTPPEAAGDAKTQAPEAAGEAKTQAPAAGSAAAVKTEGAAAIARGAIDRSLANVARACEVPIEGKPGPEIFRRMTERCGPRPSLGRQDRPPPGTATTALPDPSQPGQAGAGAGAGQGSTGGQTSPPGEPSQAGEPSKSPGPAETETKAAPAPAGGPKALPAAPNAGCLGACEAKHRTCKQGCGAEPKQSSQYTEYNACLAKCLSGNSKCKLSCN